MKFAFDSGKSVSNHAKHGVDLVEVQAFWDDEDLLVLPLRFEDEVKRLGFRILSLALEKYDCAPCRQS
jgi:uncharacterized DUF497 family protein